MLSRSSNDTSLFDIFWPIPPIIKPKQKHQSWAIITQIMGYRRRTYAITFVAIVAALWGVTKAQPSGSCVTTLTTLAPCLGYITGNSTTPSPTCCSQLDSVIKSSPQCICSAVNSPIPNIGLNINRTQALQLPNACNIQAPPLTQCNGNLTNKAL